MPIQGVYARLTQHPPRPLRSTCHLHKTTCRDFARAQKVSGPRGTWVVVLPIAVLILRRPPTQRRSPHDEKQQAASGKGDKKAIITIPKGMVYLVAILANGIGSIRKANRTRTRILPGTFRHLMTGQESGGSGTE